MRAPQYVSNYGCNRDRMDEDEADRLRCESARSVLYGRYVVACLVVRYDRYVLMCLVSPFVCLRWPELCHPRRSLIVSMGARRRVVPVCADVLCTALNPKFTHRSYMNNRVRALRVHARLTKASPCTGVTLECKGVLLCMDV